jgi:inner membrane protein
VIAGTHVAFATTLYLGGAALFEYEPGTIGWALAVGASLLPDIDLPTSRFGRVFFISTNLERNFGHRTVTHSFIALALVAALTSFLYFIEPIYFWSVVGGYWSHLWIDMLNLRGADLLWPSPVRVVFPGNPSYRMEAGSKAEMVLTQKRRRKRARLNFC